MKKISQSQWLRYKETDGKEVISLFEKTKTESFTSDDMMNLALRFDYQYFRNSTTKDFLSIRKYFTDLDKFIKEIRTDYSVLESKDDYINAYCDFLEVAAQARGEGELIGLDNIPENQFKNPLCDIIFVSLCYYRHFPDIFIPNFFVMQFSSLMAIAKKYEIDLPEMPKRSQYFNRCYYYMELCLIFNDFAKENNLTQAELCAFLYDYEFKLIKEEQEEQRIGELPQPAQAWFLVGSYGEGEKTMDSGFWQANAETKKGDILVFYEKAPVKSINAIWRATEDGIIDPFFYYYSNTYIGHKTVLPPISLDELRTDDYFKNHSLVRKQFQGGSGWPMNAEDYRQLQRILATKNFDVASLPKLKAHESPSDIDYSEKEAAVHKYQVIPLLEDMGWTEENGEVLNQVTLHVGHGETAKKGRTDISLHPYGAGLKKSKVVIEEKFWMKNDAEIRETYEQALSYANLQKAKILVICDKTQIIVFKQSRDNDFHFDKCTTFYWDEMQNPDKFNELKKLLS